MSCGTTKPILVARELSRKVATDTGIKTIIDSFTFDFWPGQIFTIVGPSGSGKTSLLRLFNRLDEKAGGQLVYHDRSVEEYKVVDLRRKIALVFQVPYMFPGTVESNIFYSLKDNKGQSGKMVQKYLSLVGLMSEIADQDPEKLSVGQQQRVSLARSLVMEPEILLLDEPTSALDPGSAGLIEDLIIKLNKELGLTIIMVTHNIGQAIKMDGFSLFLMDGKLLESAESKVLFENPVDDKTRKFINGDLL